MAAAGAGADEDDTQIGANVLLGVGALVLESQADEPTELVAFSEAYLSGAGWHGPFFARIEVGFRGTEDANGANVAIARHELRWALDERTVLIFSGNAFDGTVASLNGNVGVTNAPDGPLGNLQANLSLEDTGLVNAELTLGALTVGLALSDACEPQCGFALVAGSGGLLHPDGERRTVVPHLRGSAGRLSFNAYAASSAGRFSQSGSGGSGSAVGAGLAYRAGTWGAALDLLNATVRCNAEPPGAACAGDDDLRASGAAFTAGGFGVHVVRRETTLGTATTAETNVDLVYLFDVDQVRLGPEYRQVTTSAAGSDYRDALLLFGIAMQW